jgi:exosome complex RNA-binding protein Rrp42 (RNase PH superfamily)
MENNNICAMQKSGNSLSVEDLEKMIDLAITKTKELRKLL